MLFQHAENVTMKRGRLVIGAADRSPCEERGLRTAASSLVPATCRPVATVRARTILAEVDFHIAAGEIVTLWNVSANRDEDAFSDPYRFDVARAPNRHLTLGHGPHFCLGGPLARVELKMLLTVLLDRVPGMECAGPVERVKSSVLTGISKLPVRTTSAGPSRRESPRWEP